MPSQLSLIGVARALPGLVCFLILRSWSVGEVSDEASGFRRGAVIRSLNDAQEIWKWRRVSASYVYLGSLCYSNMSEGCCVVRMLRLGTKKVGWGR